MSVRAKHSAIDVTELVDCPECRAPITKVVLRSFINPDLRPLSHVILLPCEHVIAAPDPLPSCRHGFRSCNICGCPLLDHNLGLRKRRASS